MEDDYLRHLSRIEAFDMERLVEQYWKDVWNYAYVWTRKRDLADDIAQETFLRAFRALESFRRESSVKTWLIRIARNLAVNQRRSAFFRKIILVDQIRSDRASPSAEAVYMSGQFTDRLWGKVLRLPIKQREVLLLHAHHRLHLEDIAKLLGLPLGTVKSRLHRARTAMGQWLEAEERTDNDGEN